MRFSFDKFFVVACFCYAACLPCSLGFSVKLYINILSLMSIFIWWLYTSLNTTFLQWCLSPYYQIIALQQQSLSDIHPWRSYSGSHLGNNVIISIPDRMMLLLVLDIEVVLAFVLAIKLHQHLSFQCSHLKSLCNVATLRVFTMNPASIRPCIEAMPTFIFARKQYLYLHLLWSSTIICTEAMSTLHLHQTRANIHLCREATSALHSHRSHANIHLCHEITSTLHISTCTRIEVAPIFRGNIA